MKYLLVVYAMINPHGSAVLDTATYPSLQQCELAAKAIFQSTPPWYKVRYQCKDITLMPQLTNGEQKQ